MKRRVKALLLAIVMIATAVLAQVPAVQAAATDNGLSISVQEVHPGSEFTVTASIPKMNVMCYELQGEVSFDNSAFELLSYDVGEAIGDDIEITDVANANKVACFVFVWQDKNGFSLTDGYSVTAKFQVKENVTGKYDFNIEDWIIGDADSESLCDTIDVPSVSVNVTIPATKVTINKAELTLQENAEETLTSVMTPANTTDKVVWTSDNEKVATIDANGKVTAVASGTATITATAGKVSATCTVTVECVYAEVVEEAYKVSDATCTAKAVYKKSCSVCGKAHATEMFEYGEPLGHDYKEVAIEQPTCEETGTKAHYDCSRCDSISLDKVTECTKADLVIDAAGHTLDHVEKKDATCDVDGNIEYWKCSVCDKFFKDSEGKVEIIKKETVITAAKGHSNSGKWETDDNEHWKPCGGCGNIFKYDKGEHKYSEKMSSDEIYHWDECTVCGYVKNKAEHTGGSATCLEKATCTTCGAKYSDVGSHDYKEVVDAQYLVTPANCTDQAVYKKSCTVCKEAHATETFKSGEALGHDYKEVPKVEPKCEEKGTEFHYTCSRCTKIFDNEKKECTKEDLVIAEAGHSYTENAIDKYLKTKATCEEKAVYWKSCSACGEVHATETFKSGEALGHDYKEVPKVEPKCEEKGTEFHYTCSRCTKIFDNEKKECTKADLVIAETGHSYTENATDEYLKTKATCEEKAEYWESCSACGKAHATETFKSGEALGHDYKEVSKVEPKCETKGTEFHYTCSRCTKIFNSEKAECTKADLVIPETGHSWDNVVDEKYLVSDATCIAKAVYKSSCSVCEKAHATETFETGEVNPENHTGNTVIKDAKDAKCYELGYTGDTYCKDCDVKVADGKEIAKLPHNITSWEVTKEPTTEATGLKTGSCENEGCEEKHVVEIAKLVATGNKVEVDKVESDSEKEEEKFVVESVVVSKESNVTESVVLRVENVTNTIDDEKETSIEKVIEKIESVTEKHEMAAVLDIKMLLREETKNGEPIADAEHKLEGEVEIKLQLPKQLIKKYENLVLLHVKDDNTAEEVPYTIDENNVVTFKATGFSYYVFAGTEIKPVSPDNSDDIETQPEKQEQTETKPETEKTDVQSPTTGDSTSIVLWIIVLVLGLSAMVMVLARRKRERFN